MKKSLILASIIAGIIIISIPSISAQSESGEIPSWIKGVANFWVEGGINDTEFIEALEFLIDKNVIKLGENPGNNSSELQKEYDILKEKYDEQYQVHREVLSGIKEQYENSNNKYNQETSSLKEEYEQKAIQLGNEYDQMKEDLIIKWEKIYDQARIIKQIQDQELDDRQEESREFKRTINELEGAVQNLERENADLKRQLEAQ